MRQKQTIVTIIIAIIFVDTVAAWFASINNKSRPQVLSQKLSPASGFNSKAKLFARKVEVIAFSPDEYEVVVMAQEGFSNRLRFDGKQMHLILDGRVIPPTERGATFNERREFGEYIKRYKADHPDREIAAVMPHGNAMTNDRFIIFTDGRLYYPRGERYGNRTYSCFVVWQDGRVSIEYLKFRKDNKVIDAKTGRDITSQIVSAVYGQHIVKDGKMQDLASFCEEFDDLRQIFIYPRFQLRDGRNLFFGMAAMHKKTVLFRHALKGEEIEFSKDELMRNGISDEEFIARMAGEGYGKDEYSITGDKIKIRLRLNPYAHNLIGVKKDGSIVSITCAGDSKRHVGITITDLQRLLVDEGVRDIILLSNGSDVQLLDGEGRTIIASENARDRAASAILIVKRLKGAYFLENLRTNPGIRRYITNLMAFCFGQFGIGLDEVDRMVDIIAGCHSFEEARRKLYEADFKWGEAGNKYHDVYEGYRRNIAPEVKYNTLKDYIRGEGGFGKGSVVIDIGCGNHSIGKRMVDSMRREGVPEENIPTVIGVDLGPDPKINDPKIVYIQQDAKNPGRVPVESAGVADKIWIIAALHHMPEGVMDSILKEAHRLLKPNGELVVFEDVALESQSPIFDEEGLATRQLKDLSEEEHRIAFAIFDWHANHVIGGNTFVPITGNYYPEDKWRKVFSAAGFEVKRVRYIGVYEKKFGGLPHSVFVLRKKEKGNAQPERLPGEILRRGA